MLFVFILAISTVQWGCGDVGMWGLGIPFRCIRCEEITNIDLVFTFKSLN